MLGVEPITSAVTDIVLAAWLAIETGVEETRNEVRKDTLIVVPVPVQATYRELLDT